jgi:hypothetical protein
MSRDLEGLTDGVEDGRITTWSTPSYERTAYDASSHF